MIPDAGSFDKSRVAVGTAVAAVLPQVRHKILIVDDNDAARTGLARILERADFDVLAVGTYAEGRAALARVHPDLLIADVRLGEFNGLQLLASSPRPPAAIIVTGHPDPVIEADARRMGAEFLVKPVSPATLVDLARRKLSGVAANPQPFRMLRRWERKAVSGELAARVGNAAARVLDISYGGLRLEMDRQPEAPLPQQLTLDLPSSGISMVVDLVWTTPIGERWMCGASVAQSGGAATAWHGLVDAVA